MGRNLIYVMNTRHQLRNKENVADLQERPCLRHNDKIGNNIGVVVVVLCLPLFSGV